MHSRQDAVNDDIRLAIDANAGFEKVNCAVYCDFDGTITLQDIGDELFKAFGVFQPYNALLREGKMSISSYWKTLCSKLRPGVGANDLAAFAEQCETDKRFAPFAEYCRKRNIPVSVVSDGFDVYIEPIMQMLGVASAKVFCNKMKFNGGRAEPYFPYASESCSCGCASCKRNSVLCGTPQDTAIIYIGDGFSDFCAAEHSDIIFAKKDLAAYCNEKRIPHYPFKSFFDVQRILDNIIKQRKIRFRHQAALNRKKAFEIE